MGLCRARPPPPTPAFVPGAGCPPAAFPCLASPALRSGAPFERGPGDSKWGPCRLCFRVLAALPVALPQKQLCRSGRRGRAVLVAGKRWGPGLLVARSGGGGAGFQILRFNPKQGNCFQLAEQVWGRAGDSENKPCFCCVDLWPVCGCGCLLGEHLCRWGPGRGCSVWGGSPGTLSWL